MPRVPIPFAQHSYEDRSAPLSVQKLQNLYLEVKPDGSKNRTALHGTPGIKYRATVGDGPCRGMKMMGGTLYVVSGGSLYRVTQNGVATRAGAVSGVRSVGMDTDGYRMLITSDYDVYWATASSFGISATSSNMHGVASMDGYLITAERNSQAFYISDTVSDVLSPTDPTFAGAIDSGLANRFPDFNAGIVRVGSQIVVFGEQSAQLYYNSGNADFPFDPLPGLIERGCKSARSAVGYQGLAAWLGDDLRVYTLNGDTPVAISTTAIDRLIKTFGAHESAEAFAYTQDEHIFYVLTFPGYGTIVYDATTGRWHERVTYGRNDWLVRGHAVAWGKQLVGSATSGAIGELDLDTFTDLGTLIQRRMTSPVISAQGARILMPRLDLDAEMGVGLVTGQGSSPQIMLDWTENGGVTYSHEHWRTLGTEGAYKNRASWHRLGVFRERSYRLTYSDPCKAAWFEAYATMEGGAV